MAGLQLLVGIKHKMPSYEPGWQVILERYKEIFRTHQQEAVQENFDAVTLARTHAHKNGPINKHTHARSHTHTHAHTHTHKLHKLEAEVAQFDQVLDVYCQ